MDPEREVNLLWEEEYKDPTYKITVSIIDRVGVLSDILRIFSERNINLTAVRTAVGKEKADILLFMQDGDHNNVASVAEDIRRIGSVSNVVFEEVSDDNI